MGLWGMIVMVVFIGCLTGTLNTYFNAKAKMKGQPGVDQYNRRIEALEQHYTGNIEKRLANLEELMTDREFDFDRRLAREQLGSRDELS